MSTRNPLTIEFVAQYGDAEQRWIRIEPVEQASPLLTTVQAATVIDTTYQVSPCTGTIGTGGEEIAKEPALTQEQFILSAQRALGINICEPPEYWTAQIDVLRSHQTPGYVLRSRTASVFDTTTRISTRHESAQLDNAVSHDLRYPYHSNLRIFGVEAQILSIRGSTVNFASPVSGYAQIVYQSIADRVTLHVPRIVQSVLDRLDTSTTASVIAFWDRLAAQADIHPSEQEAEIDRARLQLCRRGNSGGSSKPEPENCWRSIEHYYKCRCSGSEAPGSWTERVPAPCPKGESDGTIVGDSRAFGGYKACEGEGDEEISDPEYYKEQCCKPPPSGLPQCRRVYSLYQGGKEISGGPDYYKRLYGDNVILTAVSPEGGICGEEIREWDTSGKNCCDDITPLSPDPNNPTEFHPGEAHTIKVLDGKPGELIWTATGGLYFRADGRDVTRLRTPARGVTVYARAEGTCPDPSIEVDDGCKPLEMTFVGGEAAPLTLPDEDYVVAPKQQFSLTATGGVPPLRWQVGGKLKLISWDQTGRTVLLEATEDFCGSEEVTVIDTCANDATVSIRSTRGQWKEVTDFDPCSAPWGGTPDGQAVGGGVYSATSGGVQAYVAVVNSGIQNFKAAQGEGLPHKGSCAEAWDKSGRIAPCGYSGAQMITVPNLSPPNCTPYHDEPTSPQGGVYSDTECFQLCYNSYVRAIFHTLPPERSYEATNNWWSQVQYVAQLWRWSCPDGAE